MSDVTSQLFSGLASLVNGQHVSESGVTRGFSDFTIAGSIAARLRLVAIEGNPTALAWIDHSDENASWTRLLTFTARAADGEEIVQVTGPKKYLRAGWSIAGGGSCRITIDVNPGIPGAPSTIVVAEPPTSDEIPVGQARVYAVNDAFNGIAVRVRARGARAGYSDGVVAYVDRTGFTADGGGTTVEHAKSELEHQPLTIDVADRAITVNFATGGDAVAASGQLGSGDSTLLFTAKATGPGGDAIEIDLLEIGPDEVADTTASATGNEVDVTLAQSGPVQATLLTTLGGNKDLKWTAGTNIVGSAGNGTQIQYIANGGLSAHQIQAGGDSDTSTFTYGPSTTANDLLTFLADNPGYAQYFSAELAPGSDGTAAIGEGTWDYADGADPAVTATAADVKDAIEADTDSNALVSVGLGAGDGSGLVQDDNSVHLAGGLDDAYETSDGADIVAAIEASPAAAALVAVKALNSDPPTVTEGPQPLSGGDADSLIDATLWSD